jgi:hypothetical protein
MNYPEASFGVPETASPLYPLSTSGEGKRFARGEAKFESLRVRFFQ